MTMLSHNEANERRNGAKLTSHGYSAPGKIRTWRRSVGHHGCIMLSKQLTTADRMPVVTVGFASYSGYPWMVFFRLLPR